VIIRVHSDFLWETKFVTKFQQKQSNKRVDLFFGRHVPFSLKFMWGTFDKFWG